MKKLLVIGTLLGLLAAVYWVWVPAANPVLLDPPVKTTRMPATAETTQVPAPASGQSPTAAATVKERYAGIETNAINVKYVDGIKMLRGQTLDGDEVWIPAAPEPQVTESEETTPRNNELLPAPHAE